MINPMEADLLFEYKKVRVLYSIWNRNFHEATAPFGIEIN
jgi:hypothetical protein